MVDQIQQPVAQVILNNDQMANNPKKQNEFSQQSFGLPNGAVAASVGVE